MATGALATHGVFCSNPAMKALCIFVGTTIGSCVGGAIAEPLGFWWAFFISGIGSIAGVYLGWKFARHLER
jgi:hypothetical protein